MLAGVGLDAQELLLVIPLVERLRFVEPLVALQPDELLPGGGRDRLRELGLADAGGALAQERLLEPIGEVRGDGDVVIRQIAGGGKPRAGVVGRGEGRRRRAQKSTGFVGSLPLEISAGMSEEPFSHTSSIARLGA